ncbi:hypothetical protein [Halarcobacter sp.]|uniref:hypothetical protein n=1 Tax=Halarcobacter sp. TaxID=2321133 RepID=UPI003A8FA924
MKQQELLTNLSKLSFEGKGESFVEQKFLSPLLECLGYETHKDYEVYRHGDSFIDFKLNYPPVENGAKKVKHYNPDYIPTIRKKIFWIIEAKSPSTTHPFEYNYITQGLQYCIHPEIQAKYLILSNGNHTDIFDIFNATFFEQDMYTPILTFRNQELINRWNEIYSLLSVEKMRNKIEESIMSLYEKLCLSSLDKNYPFELTKKITRNNRHLSDKIERHRIKLYVEKFDEEYKQTKEYLQIASLNELEIGMEYPLGRGSNNPSVYYVMKLLDTENEENIFEKLISNYDKLSYFQKEHCFVGLCFLYQQTKNIEIQKNIKDFIVENMEKPLNPLNKAETLFLRCIRKIILIHIHPKLRNKINESLKSAPEIIRFVNKPLASNYTYSDELIFHDNYFKFLKNLTEDKLNSIILELEKIENILEEDYELAQKNIPDEERDLLGGFATLGIGNKIWSLKNIATNMTVIKKEELNK